MAELRHLISTDTIERLRDVKPLLEDHTAMHKPKFLNWLTLKGERLLTDYLKDGMDHEAAMVKVASQLQDYTAEWKAAARAKAQRS